MREYSRRVLKEAGPMAGVTSLRLATIAMRAPQEKA